jgi:hypothetical protein
LPLLVFLSAAKVTNSLPKSTPLITAFFSLMQPHAAVGVPERSEGHQQLTQINSTYHCFLFSHATLATVGVPERSEGHQQLTQINSTYRCFLLSHATLCVSPFAAVGVPERSEGHQQLTLINFTYQCFLYLYQLHLSVFSLP